MAYIVGGGTVVENELFVIFVYSVVRKVHTEVSEVVVAGLLVFLSTQSAKSILMDKNSKRIATC